MRDGVWRDSVLALRTAGELGPRVGPVAAARAEKRVHQRLADAVVARWRGRRALKQLGGTRGQRGVGVGAGLGEQDERVGCGQQASEYEVQDRALRRAAVGDSGARVAAVSALPSSPNQPHPPPAVSPPPTAHARPHARAPTFHFAMSAGAGGVSRIRRRTPPGDMPGGMLRARRR